MKHIAGGLLTETNISNVNEKSVTNIPKSNFFMCIPYTYLVLNTLIQKIDDDPNIFLRNAI